VPASAIRPTADQALSIQELKRRGVPEGGFARQMQRNPVRPIDEREQFSPADGRFFVFLTWDPKERVRGTMVFRVYDESNQLVTESKPGKVDFKTGADTFSQWELSVPQRPGNYRTVVLIGEVQIWRGFFRVTP
jgi:hypothetical protein